MRIGCELFGQDTQFRIIPLKNKNNEKNENNTVFQLKNSNFEYKK